MCTVIIVFYYFEICNCVIVDDALYSSRVQYYKHLCRHVFWCSPRKVSTVHKKKITFLNSFETYTVSQFTVTTIQVINGFDRIFLIDQGNFAYALAWWDKLLVQDIVYRTHAYYRRRFRVAASSIRAYTVCTKCLRLETRDRRCIV